MTRLLTDEVSAWLGTTISYEAPEELGRASIRAFATAIGADPERWIDEAPPTLICETTQLTGKVAPDCHGYLGHVWDLPLPEPCAMIRGGNAYEFHRPVRADDRITTTWELVDLAERTDRRGVAMLIVTARAEYTGAAGDPIATNVETLIYLPVGS